MGLYRAVATGLTIPAIPTDLVTLVGSATKITKVLGVEVITTQTAFGLNTWQILRRAAQNTYVTLPTQMTCVKYDSTDDAPTAFPSFATVNPTVLGTLVGSIDVAVIAAPTLLSVVANANYLFDFSKNPIFLRSANEVMALSFGGVAKPTGLAVSVALLFSEE